MDEREELLLILWRAEEAIRPKRESFRVMRLQSPSGPLIRHGGLRGQGNEQAFIHHPRQDIEDLIAAKCLRKRRRDRGGGERWEVDLTEEGRRRAKALLASQSFGPQATEVSVLKQLVDDRIAAASSERSKGQWQAFKAALEDLDEDEVRTFIRAIRD